MPPIAHIDCAGGLVLDPRDRILLIFKDGRWDLPKGIIEEESNAEATALAEVAEETGLPEASLSVLDQLIPTHHISKYQKRRYLKATDWFLMRCDSVDSPFKPQSEEGIEVCEWRHPWELNDVMENSPPRIRYLLQFWLKARKQYLQ